ncbi:valacyclovir hydrolase isoform X4 [Stomoxys calcitrans]|uniref:AB hydrolase-1 domain-containing protein n=1 Tax=Stomoxys calcitrans TaxID=35570 RepID=A0A1I8P227_STOCA|nr:valacyclovir hydrolase isoform X4 [Stomoxys calcitrans]
MLSPRILHRVSSLVERKVNVNNISLNIVEGGSGSKSVLLMPGLMGSIWSDFKHQVQQLPELLPNHKIIAWDPPGYGKSTPPQRNWHVNSLHEDAELAVDLMRNLGRPKFSMVAWSSGAMTAIIAASRHQQNVDKIVMWGGSAYLTQREIKSYKQSRDVSKWPVHMLEPMERIYGADKFPQLWSEFVDAICALDSERGGDFCKDDLKNVTAPIFLLHGKRDFVKDPEHVHYFKQRLNVKRYHEFPEGKHNIHLRYPDEFNRLVADFLLDQSEKS